MRRLVPRGPPSIQLSTWNERPKRQVSIKIDRDYWIGVGGAALRPTQPARDTTAASSEQKGVETVAENQRTQRSSSFVEQSNNANPSSDTVQRLTRQYIVHTTPSGFRRTADSAAIENSSTSHPVGKSQNNQKISFVDKQTTAKTHETVEVVSGKPVTSIPGEMQKSSQILPQPNSSAENMLVEVPVTPKNDPSRVPIVRAVELKKSALAIDLRKPLLRQNATSNSSVVYFSSGPVATSSVSASSKQVNVNHTNSAKPTTSSKKFTSVVDISGPTSEKPVNGSCENQPNIKGPSVHINGFGSNSEPKRNLPMPVVKGFKLAQGVVNRQLSAPAATPPPPNAPAPPPPAPVLPVLKRIARPSSLPARVLDPRDQLLDAIRNFGGRTNLRPVSITFGTILISICMII